MYHKQFKNGIAFAILIWSLDMPHCLISQIYPNSSNPTW